MEKRNQKAVTPAIMKVAMSPGMKIRERPDRGFRQWMASDGDGPQWEGT